jgi:N-acetylmuramoyl-L-alanine amidase
MTVLIRQGERSGQVGDIQARLRGLGYGVDDEAGFYGEKTTEAVRAFQQVRGIISDGIVGPNTWAELVEASWHLGDRVLYMRHPLMRGDDVVTLQARLNALGYDAGREDGIFGPDTARAVRAFQREYAVAEDGMFGPQSHAALVGLRVERPGTSALLREELRMDERGHVAGALVVIDPGHGGVDLGDLGPQGLVEADVCWDVARVLAEKILGHGARVRFTRTEAEGPDDSERARRANRLGADIFVSLHLNSHREDAARGASTFYFRSSAAGGRLAESIQDELTRLGIMDCRSHPRSYPLLKETRMPAVVIEPCFITNPDEEKRLDDPDFRVQLADAIAAGVKQYFERRVIQAMPS